MKYYRLNFAKKCMAVPHNPLHKKTLLLCMALYRVQNSIMRIYEKWYSPDVSIHRILN